MCRSIEQRYYESIMKLYCSGVNECLDHPNIACDLHRCVLSRSALICSSYSFREMWPERYSFKTLK